MKGRSFIAGLSLAAALLFAGCGGDPAPTESGDPPVPPCDHPYTEWIAGEETHYQICPVCGQKHDEDPHRFENIYGLSYTLKKDATAMVRVAPAEEPFAVREVWVYVGASEATLRLGHGTNSQSSFYNADELVLTGKGGWFEIELSSPVSYPLYPYFRLQAVGGDITVREIVFFGSAEGEENAIIPMAAVNTAHSALVDCPQNPGEEIACTVCGKVPNA